MAFITLPPGAEVLGAMITPAMLISASGTLVLSTSNRLGRVVDRIRQLSEGAEHLEDAASDPASIPRAAEKRALITAQLVHLTRRLELLQKAITVLYATIGILVATSISVGVTFTLHIGEGWVSVSLGLVGAAALFYVSMLLVRETRSAVRSSRVELGYTQRVVERVMKQ